MLPTVAVLTPLSGQDRFNGNLLPIWSSWYRLDYPKDRIKFIFTVPKAGESQAKFVEENFKLPHEVLRYEVVETTMDDDFHHRRLSELAANRNLLLKRATMLGFDYCWFLDSDVEPPRNAIRQFVRDNVDVVGGLVNIPDQDGRFRPGFGYFTPLFQFAIELPKEPLARCGAVNTACMFISKKVMQNSKATFDLINIPSQVREILFSEDHAFCAILNSLGYKVFIDTTIRCVHMRLWDGKMRREVIGTGRVMA